MSTHLSLGGLLSKTNAAFEQVFHDFFKNGIELVYLSDYPQRAEALVEGYAAVVPHYPHIHQKMKLYGGRTGENPFPQVAQQYGYEGNFENFSGENVRGIAALLPKAKYAIASYEQCPDVSWESVIPTENIAALQYHSSLGILILENKQWLGLLLDCAGATTARIPFLQLEVDAECRETAHEQFAAIVEKLQSPILVLQGGLTTHGGTSGSDTAIVTTALQFQEALQQRHGRIKCVRYVSGLQGNYSIVVGNTRKSQTGFGCVQAVLPHDFDYTTIHKSTIEGLVHATGLGAQEVVCIPVRGSAKIVGEPHCTYYPLEGSVHDIGYVYSPEVRQQLYKIGIQLGSLAARMGYVGIMGFDFIVDADDHVWVNEINARQQGPTTMMGSAAERLAGLPDCMKLAYVFAFSSQFGTGEFSWWLHELQRHTSALSELYATSPGSYYIKVQTLHQPSERRTVVRTLEMPACYKVVGSRTPTQPELLARVTLELKGLSSELPSTILSNGVNSPIHGEGFLRSIVHTVPVAF